VSSRFIAICVLFVSLVAARPAAAEDAAARLQRVLDDLDVMEALLGGRMSDATRRELIGKVQSARVDVREVQQDLLRNTTTASVGVSTGAGPLVSITMQVDEPDMGFEDPMAYDSALPPEPIGPIPMNPDQLRSLLGAVESESFSDSKAAVLRDACRANFFTVDQAVTLVSLFDFGDDKVEAAAMLHPRLVDPENFYRVYAVFDFDSDKEELRERLGL